MYCITRVEAQRCSASQEQYNHAVAIKIDLASCAWRCLMSKFFPGVSSLLLFLCCLQPCAAGAEEGFVDLFPRDGTPEGWSVREWNDLSKVKPQAVWTVSNGVLKSDLRRDAWLISDKEYGDFTLEFEIKLGELGNSGVALRAPLHGDPAFDGMEMQVADYRYNTSAKDSELTGGIYRALAPTKQVYRPTQWNRFRIELKGDHLKVTANGELIQEVDLSTQDQPVKRHDGSPAPPIKDRPRQGHIGFQFLSRDGVPVEIRGARIKA